MFVLTRNKLQELADLRVREAQVLFDAGLYDGSVYLCGYIIELALKACICKALNITEYPEAEIKGFFKTHIIKDLLLLAGLRDQLQQQEKLSPDFASNWQIVTKIGPEQRYQSGKSQSDAQDILTAVTSKPDGVLEWLSQQW